MPREDISLTISGYLKKGGVDPYYLHDGDVDGVGDGVSLPQQEVDVEGLEELFVVLSADTFVLSGDAHIERRFFRAGFRKRR